MHGDYMIIRTDLDPKDGELAVFYIPGEGFSVKKIDMENNCLVPLNKDFPKIPVGPDEVVETKGVIKAIFRDIESLDF